MHKYLDRLEKRAGNTASGRFLFNRYYNIKDFYWTILYTTAFGILAGFGNAFPGLQSSLADILYAFAQGFLNNTYLAIVINIFYARIINFLSKKEYFRYYGNTLWAFVQLSFLAWHYFIGTENPVETMILPALLAFLLTNYHISKVRK